MALGLRVRGWDSVPFDKFNVGLSFGGAWRAWGYNGRFPQVSTDLRKGLDGVWALTHANEAKHVWCLFWRTEGTQLTIHTRDPDWDPADADDVRYALDMLDGDVPLDGWLALADEFIRRFGH